MITDISSRHDDSNCPVCGEKGRPVLAMTIKALTDKEWEHRDNIKDGFICDNPDDSTIYYIPEKDLIIDKSELGIRVGIKEQEEPIPICYCYNYTKADIEEDYISSGQSNIENEIRLNVSRGLCSCEVKNPSGRCCLGRVRQTYQAVQVKSTE